MFVSLTYFATLVFFFSPLSITSLLVQPLLPLVQWRVCLFNERRNVQLTHGMSEQCLCPFIFCLLQIVVCLLMFPCSWHSLSLFPALCPIASWHVSLPLSLSFFMLTVLSLPCDLLFALFIQESDVPIKHAHTHTHSGECSRSCHGPPFYPRYGCVCFGLMFEPLFIGPPSLFFFFSLSFSHTFSLSLSLSLPSSFSASNKVLCICKSSLNCSPCHWYPIFN